MQLKSLVIAGSIALADQLTKGLISARLHYAERIEVAPFFDLVLWHNDGAAFSILATAGGWQRWFFVALGITFTGFILYELRRLPESDRLMRWVYGLILGGALGNLIDRIGQGYVVDFLLFHYGDAYFPAFNLADSALTCGAILWIWRMFGEWREERARNVHNHSTH